MQNPQQTARVGLFFVLGLALIWVTFETLSGGKLWFKDKGYLIIAGFESLKELKEGDHVRMAGVKIGEVARTRLAGRRAEAILRIDTTQKIRSDAYAMIVTTGLIGTGYISIDLGTEAAPYLREGAEIRTRSTPDLNAIMSQFGDLGRKIEGALGNLGTALTGDGKQTGIIQKVEQFITENRDNVNQTTANLQQITDKVNKGGGTFSRLINDPKLHDDLVASIAEIRSGAAEAKSFIANAQGILDQVKSGKGTLGALVFDQTIGGDLKASISSLRSLSEKIARGEGTLGKLIQDDSMIRDARSLLKKADRALDGFDDSGPLTAVGVLVKGLF
jgi:phospholipid/cholesterol/gamma-HCH transport system substrate-binding protein